MLGGATSLFSRFSAWWERLCVPTTTTRRVVVHHIMYACMQESGTSLLSQPVLFDHKNFPTVSRFERLLRFAFHHRTHSDTKRPTSTMSASAVLGGRIPASLQAIFTASNKGEEVHAPPTDKSAFKVYGLTSKGAAKPVVGKYANGSGFKRNLISVSRVNHSNLSTWAFPSVFTGLHSHMHH